MRILKLFGERVRSLRHSMGLSQEGLALSCDLDRTYIGGVERGERNISLLNIQKISEALGVPLDKLLQFGEDDVDTLSNRKPAANGFVNSNVLKTIGLNHKIIKLAIRDTYTLLDSIDQTLETAGVLPLSKTVELANLSSMIGNILGAAIAKHSQGLLRRNGPHKFPDLLTTNVSKEVPDIELKMALETNKPKGHLAKEGFYLTCRYVLCQADGLFISGKDNRGIKAYIWEIRCGYLDSGHFNLSNTKGDSGKTAVVNARGMDALKIVYCDIMRIPLSQKGKLYKSYLSLLSEN